MISKKTAFLLLIFIGLLAYVYFFEVLGSKRKHENQQKEEKILQVDRENTARLELLPANIVIERRDAGWKILSPVATDADQAAIDAIITDLGGLKKGRFVSDNPVDFKKFGLMPFQAALVIQGQDGKRDSLLLGHKNLDSTQVFFRNSESQNVYLIPASLLNHVSSSPYDLREKAVIKFKKDEISRILIQNQNQIFSCAKHSAGDWYLEHPIQERCDQDRIDSILDKLELSRISAFVSERPDNLSRYGLLTPGLSVSLFDSNRVNQKTLFVGKSQADKFYARDDSRSQIFMVDSSLVSGLSPGLFDLRDKTIVSFDHDSIVEIEIKYHSSKFHCIKDSANKWIMLEPDSGLAKPWKISTLLYDINDFKIAGFIDKPVRGDDGYGFKTPAIELILKGEQAMIANLMIGNPINSNIFLKNKLTNKIYQVKKIIKTKLQVDTQDYIDSEN